MVNWLRNNFAVGNQPQLRDSAGTEITRQFRHCVRIAVNGGSFTDGTVFLSVSEKSFSASGDATSI
jgi:hypothetical protein